MEVHQHQGMMRRALTNKGRRATLDGCMLVVEPLGAVPFPEPDPAQDLEDDDPRRSAMFTGVSVAAGGHVAWARQGRLASNGKVRATAEEAAADIPALVAKLLRRYHSAQAQMNEVLDLLDVVAKREEKMEGSE